MIARLILFLFFRETYRNRYAGCKPVPYGPSKLERLARRLRFWVGDNRMPLAVVVWFAMWAYVVMM